MFSALAITGFALVSPVASGQQVLQRIEALANDEIISALDLQQRLGLIVALAGGINSEEELLLLRDQVLKAMVDEKLKVQEANQFDVMVVEGDIVDAYARVSASYNMTPEQFDQFLGQYGTGRETMMEQFRAEFQWQRLVSGRLGSQIVISDEEISAALQRMLDNVGKYEYRVGEIYLIIDNPVRADAVEEVAKNLVRQIREGGPFKAIAQQFSDSASAARGGDLGWVAEGQLSDELNEALLALEPGTYSDPIRTAGGFYILYLEDRRRILSADPLDEELDLWQIYYEFNEDTTEEKFLDWRNRATVVADRLSSCEAIPEEAEGLDNADFGRIGLISLRDLGPELRGFLVDVELEHSSRPITTPDGIRLFIICGRVVPDISPPTEDELYGQLQSRRLAMMERRYLRDLRRDAIIDYR